MNTADPTLAARFFFRNCAVSLHLPGEMRISRSLKPSPDDIRLNRDFTPIESPSEFIGPQSDFYTFINESSESNASLIKKLCTIGYILCNKLDRNPAKHRSYGFICVNEEKGAYCNGKSLFAKALGLFCVCERLSRKNLRNSFGLSGVTGATQIVVIDGFDGNTSIRPFYTLCTSPWLIQRKTQPVLLIESAKSPHLILTSSASVAELPSDGSFRRRFVSLEFSSYWNESNRIEKYFGHAFFDEWSKEQWHMFDNFMFYCVLEYLRDYSNGNDVFSFYK